jgi:hypothetical protein
MEAQNAISVFGFGDGYGKRPDHRNQAVQREGETQKSIFVFGYDDSVCDADVFCYSKV